MNPIVITTVCYYAFLNTRGRGVSSSEIACPWLGWGWGDGREDSPLQWGLGVARGPGAGRGGEPGIEVASTSKSHVHNDTEYFGWEARA